MYILRSRRLVVVAMKVFLPLRSLSSVVFVPCSNLLNITVSALIESASIKIISIAGQTVLEKNNQNGTDFILDVTHLTKGVYLVQITDSTSSTTSKFIKQ